MTPLLHATPAETRPIYESFGHCTQPDIWSEYSVRDSKIITENTVQGLTAKYLGCRSAIGHLPNGTDVDGLPKNGIIGIRYRKFAWTNKIKFTLNRGLYLTKKYQSAIGHDREVLSFEHPATIDLDIHIGIKDWETLVVFDVLAEHGCRDKIPRSALVAVFKAPANTQVPFIRLRLNKPCSRNYEITDDRIVEAFPFESIFLVRLKTKDNRYYYRVKKYLYY